PIFAELGAASQICDGENSAVFKPDIALAGERRREAYVETAIPGEQGRIVSVQLNSFFIEDKDGNFGAVLRRVPKLLYLVLRRIDRRRIHFPPELRRQRGFGHALRGGPCCCSCEIQVINAGRNSE